MGQIFNSSANTIARVSILAVALAVVAGGATWYAYGRSVYVRLTGVPRDQTVPFSHEHHVSGLGIDCRYCHSSVEVSAYAGMPPTATCMNCHSQIWSDSPMLSPVRQSYATNQPLHWTRVTDLPDYVYFNHSIHVAKGFGCATCHGQVDQMPLTWKDQAMFMSWCLECHRQPEKYIRPRDKVFDMKWKAPANQLEQGRELVKTNGVRDRGLTDCWTCHR